LIVVDTSAVLNALLKTPADERLLDRLGREADLHAPHLIDVEILHAARGLVRARKLTEDAVERFRRDYEDLSITRYPHQPLSDRIWELRHTLTAYDAAFIALSEGLGVPLVTCDRRLARSSGHDAQIELFAN
jgi:predicted nucleic acid-binding protein